MCTHLRLPQPCRKVNLVLTPLQLRSLHYEALMQRVALQALALAHIHCVILVSLLRDSSNSISEWYDK